MVLRAVVASVLAVGIAGCGATSSPSSQLTEVEELHVVATTSILADVAHHVVGEAGNVDALMQVGTDPHAFRPSAAEVRRLEEADLIVANGLGLEEALLDTLAAAEQRGAKVLRVAEKVDPLPFRAPQPRHLDEHEQAAQAGEAASEAGQPDEHEHARQTGEVASEAGNASLDPHFWQDPLRMVEAVKVIKDGLVAADQSAAATVTANADAYSAALADLHADVEQILAAVPPSNRKLVTNHETLSYFAARYGFDIIATVVPGGGTLAHTSSQQLAELGATIRRAGVGAIFVETTSSPRLAEALSQELDGQVEVVELYTDSLGPEGSDADTYLDMMGTNARRIADALRT
ncbi:MAG: metal ABC transporter substrate-binding protein [Actinomycetota bacterium]|nr:metal ABC transporter substrate-binding protein [Actinomycetota bacterium]